MVFPEKLVDRMLMDAKVAVGTGARQLQKSERYHYISILYIRLATIVSAARALSGVCDVTEMAKIAPAVLFVWGNWHYYRTSFIFNVYSYYASIKQLITQYIDTACVIY